LMHVTACCASMGLSVQPVNAVFEEAHRKSMAGEFLYHA